jgi:hypothetical protein
MGALSSLPDRYFRMPMIGCSEALDSERGKTDGEWSLDQIK